MTHYLLYFFIFLILIILIGKYVKQKNTEHFDSFSPYNQPQTEVAKKVDQRLLQSHLREYEKVTPCGGYIDMGPLPPNPIYYYPTLSFHSMYSPDELRKDELYSDPFHANSKLLEY